MFRAFVLFCLLVCFLCFAKVGYQRCFPAKDKASGVTQLFGDVWEADGRLLSYPTAALSKWPHLVKSPYLEDTLLNVQHLAPGRLVSCEKTKKPFYVPYRHGLEYGHLAGRWKIQRFERSKTIEYDVRIKAQLQGFSGEGKRIRVNGRALAGNEQTSITLKNMRFDKDVLHCEFEEGCNTNKQSKGSFQWRFSSVQGLLQGEARFAQGLRSVVSEGSRYGGLMGRIPATVSSPRALVPEGWALLGSVQGALSSQGGVFYAVVAQEDGQNPRRWLILAQREGKHGQCKTILATPHACRAYEMDQEGQADPFLGLSLPNQDLEARPGEFALRHHITLDDLHQGEDLWFRYSTNHKEWLFVEGAQYGYELKPGSSKSMSIWPLKPGVTLAEFSVNRLLRLNPPVVPPQQSKPSFPSDLTPYLERPVARVSGRSERIF